MFCCIHLYYPVHSVLPSPDIPLIQVCMPVENAWPRSDGYPPCRRKREVIDALICVALVTGERLMARFGCSEFLYITEQSTSMIYRVAVDEI
eukprot:768111-Hanusia_phi.AAC.5